MTTAARITYQPVTDPVANPEQIGNLLREAVGRIARQIVLHLPRELRTDEDQYFVHDCIRGRRAASGETLAHLLTLLIARRRVPR